MMNDRETDEGRLEQAFEKLRARRTQPSADLVARVLRDADTVRSAPGLDRSAAAHEGARAGAGQRRRRRWPLLALPWRGLSAAAGLAAATLVGVWIGVAAPAPLQRLEAALLAVPVVLDLGEEFALALDE